MRCIDFAIISVIPLEFGLLFSFVLSVLVLIWFWVLSGGHDEEEKGRDGWSLGVVVPVHTGYQPPTDCRSSCEDGCGQEEGDERIVQCTI